MSKQDAALERCAAWASSIPPEIETMINQHLSKIRDSVAQAIADVITETFAAAFAAGCEAEQKRILGIASNVEALSASGSNDDYEYGYRAAAAEITRRIKEQE